jgi:hypothetical protein
MSVLGGFFVPTAVYGVLTARSAKNRFFRTPGATWFVDSNAQRWPPSNLWNIGVPAGKFEGLTHAAVFAMFVLSIRL